MLLAQVLDCCTFDHMEPILNVIKKQAANLHPTALGVLVLSLFQMLTQASKLMPQVLNIGSEIIETFYKIRNETFETEKELNLDVDKVFMFEILSYVYISSKYVIPPFVNLPSVKYSHMYFRKTTG